jgi:hypothetical protein
MYLSKHITKTLRYSLGAKIDSIFCDVLENISLAQFSENLHRLTFIARAISKNDTLKFLLFALLEVGGIDQKKYIEFSTLAEEIGRMLYGWKCSTEEKLGIKKELKKPANSGKINSIVEGEQHAHSSSSHS